ncbi:Hypothetical protein A7A1_0028 [Bacillus subtilis subsp. subtilis str. BSP1]|nr:Hypothetical protein A7A1_0028 [Bacillus subtilis subsp. subtilis str. BSP1]
MLGVCFTVKSVAKPRTKTNDKPIFNFADLRYEGPFLFQLFDHFFLIRNEHNALRPKNGRILNLNLIPYHISRRAFLNLFHDFKRLFWQEFREKAVSNSILILLWCAAVVPDCIFVARLTAFFLCAHFFQWMHPFFFPNHAAASTI